MEEDFDYPDEPDPDWDEEDEEPEGCESGWSKEACEMDVKLSELPLLKPAPATLEKAKAILYGPLRDTARAHKNVSSWVAVGQYSVSEQMNRVCHVAMYHVTNKRQLGAKYTKRGKIRKHKGEPLVAREEKRPQFRYLVNYTCHCCKPAYWSRSPDMNVPFDGQRLRAVMAWYNFLCHRSHWARFFVGPKDMFTLLNYGSILDLSAPSFVVHFMCVAFRLPGEYIEQVESWFELCERGIDPHMAFGAAMQLEGWDSASGPQHIARQGGHSLMGMVLSVEAITRIVKGVALVANKSELDPSFTYYTTACNQAYGCRYGNQRWDEELKKQPDMSTFVESKTLWGGTQRIETLKPGLFADAFAPGWQWLMKRVVETAATRGW